MVPADIRRRSSPPNDLGILAEDRIPPWFPVDKPHYVSTASADQESFTDMKSLGNFSTYSSSSSITIITLLRPTQPSLLALSHNPFTGPLPSTS